MPIDPEESVALLVFGAGGHGRVVADAALIGGNWRAVIASDRQQARCQGELLPGVALHVMDVQTFSTCHLHVAIGDNRARESESRSLVPMRIVSVIHPQASVSDHATVAAGCFVAAQSVVAAGVLLGEGVIVNHGAVVDHDSVIGAFSHVAPGSVLGGAVKLGERVLVGSGAVVQPVRFVCSDVVIGAGAVVCADIVEPGTYVGIPARRVG
jgi:sugar O-acyltransferase (sialic acid O-acetyltransferase NeuD family)